MVQGGKMNKCAFCEKLKKMILNKDSPFDKKSEEALKMNLECVERELKKDITKTDGYCRGHHLCCNHIGTIKRDNKYRIKKGIDIPTTLEVLRLLNDDY